MAVRAADYIMEKLSSMGARHIFMVTGRGVLYLSDAAAKSENITGVSMHHEQACAYAAMAYSQYNGKMGACLVSTGCAGTNAITPVLCAWQDGVPMAVISGQNTLRETQRFSGIPLRTWGQQEADIVSIVKPVTKYAVMLTSPDRTVYETEKALWLATHGRKGPVWIDVPLDIQNMRIEPEEQEHFIPDTEDNAPESPDIEYVCNCLERSRRPVILIGSGIRACGSENALKELAEKNNIPVVYSASAADVYSYDEPFCMGSVGMMACSRAGAFALQNSDMLLVLGNRLSPMTTGSEYGKFARAAKIIVVDIDETEHSKNTVRIDKFIKADVGMFLDELNTRAISGDFGQWNEKCAYWKEIFPLCEDIHRNKETVDLYRLSEALSEVMAGDHTLLTDAGLEELILPSNVIFSGDRRCLHPASQGAMGYALPAAAGAYFSGAENTAAVIGDGSVMMNLQELATIAYNKLPVKIIIINNELYSVIRKRQKDIFRTRTIGTDPGNGVGVPAFSDVAKAFGIEYMYIDSDSGLEDKLRTLFASNGAVICEIKGDPSQDYTCCSVARTSERKFVSRPLEDQAPFLDRELFLKEMIIDPIDQ